MSASPQVRPPGRGGRVAAIAAAAASLALAAAPAAATTGDGEGLPPPKATVKPQIADRFAGRFFLSRVAGGASIVSGQLDMDYTDTERSFFIGTIELFVTSSRGARSSIAGTVYPIEYSRGRIAGNLLVDGTDDQVFGRLSLDVPARREGPERLELQDIRGVLTLERKRYAVAFRRGSDDGPPPSPLPRAKQVA